MENWRASDWLPEKAKDIEKLNSALALYEKWLIPCTDQEFTEQIMIMVKFAKTFGIPTDNVTSSAAFYAEALSSLPIEMLKLAMSRSRASLTWDRHLPLPGDIRSMVSAEVARVKLDRGKIDMAIKRLQRDAKDRARLQSAFPILAVSKNIHVPICAPEKNPVVDISEAEFEKKRAEYQAAADAEIEKKPPEK